jgi:hypothetical protein
MEREPNIYSQSDTPPEDFEKAKQAIKAEQEKAKELIENEVEPTTQQKEIIELAIQNLNERLLELGLDAIETPWEQIHFLPNKIFKKLFPEDKGANAFSDGFSIIAKHNFENPVQLIELYIIILHETIHSNSFQRHYYDPDKDKTIMTRRGYFSVNKDDHEHFRGFLEVITQRMTLDIMEKNKGELFKIADLEIEGSDEATTETRNSDPYVEVITLIIKKIAQQDQKKEEEILDEFEIDMFTGRMHHLKKVERIFGKGALRVLAALSSATKKKPWILVGGLGNFLWESTMGKLALEFFQADDPKKRDQIAKGILNQEEYNRFKNRTQN